MPRVFTIGICALDKKSRSAPMRNILDRLLENLSNRTFELIIFGDKVILEESIENWPVVDFLLGFYSMGFPLSKAIAYVRLRKPFCVNDLPMQWLLLDRRLVLIILDSIDILTPRRLVVTRDNGPELPHFVARKISRDLGVDFRERLSHQPDTAILIDESTLQIGSDILRKPFVEKPVSGDDHNIYIYYHGGGVRRLFRKLANRSSDFTPNGTGIRESGSFIYEEFLSADSSEDVKVYTVGPYFAYAETRKSPTVDGVVQRNASGKELRKETMLSQTEQEIARKICMAFGQTICGFDMVRVNGRSYVIDVNGWSFVKGSSFYYDTCASILKSTFLKTISSRISTSLRTSLPPSAVVSRSWILKTYISFIRHADRTPKQKLKFVLPLSFFEDFNLHCKEQTLLRDTEDLSAFSEFISGRTQLFDTNPRIAQLESLSNLVKARVGHADTKIQVRKLSPDSILVVVKWGGEFTHAGWHHAQEFGNSLRSDLKLLNKELVTEIQIFSSEERRVKATAIVAAKALMHLAKLPPGLIINAPDLLDDNLEAKEEMDQAKISIQEYLQHVSGPDETGYSAVESFPMEFQNEPILFISRLTRLLEDNFVHFKAQPDFVFVHKWCCPDSAVLWKERWMKIFTSLKSDKKDLPPLLRDPGKICELFDSLKYDSIHNRPQLEFFFLKDSLHELFLRTKIMYDFVCPSEYGITTEQKISIGRKIVGNLLRKLVADLEESLENTQPPSSRLYFTKESHMYPLLNLIRFSALSEYYSSPESHWELDYLSQITFEVYERCSSTEDPEHSVRISLSQGAYSSCILDVNLDEKHALSVTPREWITEYIPLKSAIALLKSEF